MLGKTIPIYKIWQNRRHCHFKCKSLTNDNKYDYVISIEIIIDLHMQLFISILLLAREQK